MSWVVGFWVFARVFLFGILSGLSMDLVSGKGVPERCLAIIFGGFSIALFSP